MSATLTMLGLWKSAQISLPLLKAGFKLLRDHALSGAPQGEGEKALQDILGDRVKGFLSDKISALSLQQLEEAEAPLVEFTGIVLKSLVKDVLETDDFASMRDLFAPALPQVPRRWKTFVNQGIVAARPLDDTSFLVALQAAHEGRGDSLPTPPAWLAALFSQWIRGDIGEVPFREGWHLKLADAVAPLIGGSLSCTLAADHPVALAAFRESMLLFQKEHSRKLSTIDQCTQEIAKKQKSEGRKSTRRHKELKSGISKVEAMLVEQTAPGRLAAYKRALLAAFSAYQELALDNFAAADQTCPDIWDIFVHPACAENHLRPEEMDAAQMEKPPRLPAADLLPLLAQDDHRRTVLLADPGMGKSTLIQALIAHLASGRPLSGAPALTGLLPVPLILRDLVPLLPQDQVEGWNWDSLLTVLIGHYQREETAPLLCEAFKGHEAEFRQFIHNGTKVFFLIDGLDEIGDLVKRRKIVQCIQDGIRAVSNDARWLITSRVIGYADAPVDEISGMIRLEDIQSYAASYLKGAALDKMVDDLIDQQTGFGNFVGVRKTTSGTFFDLSPFAPKGEADSVQKVEYGIESVVLGPKGDVIRTYEVRIAQLLYLAPFDDKRQDAFASRWFRHRHSTDHSRELMREVRAHHHDGVRIISRVPNLLCMMNMLKRSGKPLPDGRAALYDEIVKAYLGGIESAYKHKPLLGLICPFDASQRRFLLALLGASMQQSRMVHSVQGRRIAVDLHASAARSASRPSSETEGAILIPKVGITIVLRPAFERMLATSQVRSEHSASMLLDELLHHIASRSGLLIPRSSDEHGDTLYGFTHLSFLEFFAAEWLGMEFDRQRNRIVRRAEAAADGLHLTEGDLDREFPPRGPVQHSRGSFQDLPAIPAWHEPLIFLLETRKADAPTLLRWLFPALHSANREQRTENQEPAKPLLPLDAVRLLVKLTADPEIPIPAERRQEWWQRLWSAYLDWPYPPWQLDENKRWPIAPLLLGGAALRAEVLQALAAVQPQHPDRPLDLYECHQLTSADLAVLRGLDTLKHLKLGRCTGLEDTAMLAGLGQLQTLDLNDCTGLKGAAAFQGLAGLASLKVLDLEGCIGLEDTAMLAGLRELQTLYLCECTGLKGSAAFQGLVGLIPKLPAPDLLPRLRWLERTT